ncbi:MAG: hypothetical protein ACJ789_13415 [Thermomicrobiales bacterium]
MEQSSGEDITRYTEPHQESQPIGLVQPGMKVVDAAGNDVGKVSDLKMGDPQAATDLGEHPEDVGWGVGVFAVGSTGPNLGAGAVVPAEAGGPGPFSGEPSVPLPIQGRLLREGYVKIDGGLFHGDYYAAASTIESVSKDTVRLSVAKDDLPKR